MSMEKGILFALMMITFYITKENTVSAASCDDNWIAYNKHCYLFHQSSRSWNNSRFICQYLSADLVTINDKSEEHFIDSMLILDKYYWIGYNDILNENEFKWISGETANYTNWGKVEPNGFNYENCVVTFVGKWIDISCNRKYPFICEKESSNPSIPTNTFSTTTNSKMIASSVNGVVVTLAISLLIAVVMLSLVLILVLKGSIKVVLHQENFVNPKTDNDNIYANNQQISSDERNDGLYMALQTQRTKDPCQNLADVKKHENKHYEVEENESM